MSDATAGITSLPFAPGSYPFALTADDPARTLSGDQWAWRFLRLSPTYRHDYALWAVKPSWSTKRPIKTVAALKAELPDAEWQALLGADSRYFALDGKPLGHAIEWPNLRVASLREALSEAQGREADIKIRDLDAPRLYGIGHWFDPEQADLPPLDQSSGVRSWFHNFTEPVWEGALPSLLPRPDAWTFIDSIRINIGMEPDIGVFIPNSGMTHYAQQPVVAADGTITSKLVKVTQAPQRAGFATQTEVAILVCLDGNLPVQHRNITKLLQSAQEAIFPGQTFKGGDGYEPILVSAEHPRATSFGKLRGDLKDLTEAAPQGRRHWRLAIFDVQFALREQLDWALEKWTAQQIDLSNAGQLSTPLRQRAGNMHEGNFWLKAALCSLEAQISLMARYPTASFGRQNLTEIILSLSHPLHKEVRGSGVAARQADDDELVKDLVNKAVKNGRILALGQYAQLIGTSAKELLPVPEAEPKKRRRPSDAGTKTKRYSNGKEVAVAPPKRTAAKRV